MLWLNNWARSSASLTSHTFRIAVTSSTSGRASATFFVAFYIQTLRQCCFLPVLHYKIVFATEGGWKIEITYQQYSQSSYRPGRSSTCRSKRCTHLHRSTTHCHKYRSCHLCCCLNCGKICFIACAPCWNPKGPTTGLWSDEHELRPISNKIR